MTSENLNIILTNAVCCASEKAAKVSKLLSIGDRCAESELVKLKLINDYIEILRCYNIDGNNSIFSLRLTDAVFNSVFNGISQVDREYTVVINNQGGKYLNQIYSSIGTNVNFVKSIFANVLNTIPGIVTFRTESKDSGFAGYYIETDCDIQSIDFVISDGPDIVDFDQSLAMYSQGYCTPINCTSEEYIDIIISKLMKECDICECQLTQ